MITQTPYSVSLDLIRKAKDYVKPDDFRISINEPTNRFFYDPWKIKEEYKNTIWEEILSTLPIDIGEARIVQLKHGTCYMSHCDIDDRLHLGIEGQYSYLIDIDAKQMHEVAPDGKWSEMNTGVRHVAANFGSITRTQVVVRKLLNDVNIDHPVKIKITPICENPRFEFDDIISPWLNRLNKLFLLRNFQPFENGVYFEMHKSKLSELDLFPKDKFIIDIIEN